MFLVWRLEGGGRRTMFLMAKTKRIQPPGIETGSSAWQADILPLDHGCECRGDDQVMG